MRRRSAAWLSGAIHEHFLSVGRLKQTLSFNRYEQTGGRIYVCEIVPGSPAAVSGQIRVGDILLSVDNQRVQGQRLESVNRLVSGPIGSQVGLEFQHEDGSTARLSLERAGVYGR